MPNSDDDATEFRAASLRDIIDEQEGTAPKAPGPQRNRQLVLIGGGAAVVLIVLVVVMLLAGRGGNDTKASGKTAAANVRLNPGLLTSAMVKNAKVTVCSTETGLVAKDVVIRGRRTEKQGIITIDVLEVAATPDEAGRLTGLLPHDTKVVAVGVPCPAANTTTTQPSTSEQAPATTPPASQPATAPPTPPSSS